MIDGAAGPRPVSIVTAEHYTWGRGCDGWHFVNRAALSVIRERMPPATSEARHFHTSARQFFYVLSGSAVLEVDGAESVLSTGEGLEVPPGSRHQNLQSLPGPAGVPRRLAAAQPRRQDAGDDRVAVERPDAGGRVAAARPDVIPRIRLLRLGVVDRAGPVDRDDRFGADDPGVVPGRQVRDRAGAEVHLAAIMHRDVQAARHNVLKVGRLDHVVPAIGLTSFAQRQPGSSVMRPTVPPPMWSSSIRPCGKRRAS